MRFHHAQSGAEWGAAAGSQAQRRGRHQHGNYRFGRSGTSRWSQLGHCRETNIYFNRRLPVECPAAMIDLDDDDGNDYYDDNLDISATAAAAAAAAALAPETDTPPVAPPGAAAANHQANREPAGWVREKLIAQVQKHLFWSNKAAKRMELRSVEPRNVYVCELESFCERRHLEWRFEPYRGGLSGPIVAFRARRACEDERLAAIGSDTTSGLLTRSQPPTTKEEEEEAPSVEAKSRSKSDGLSFEPLSARLEHFVPSSELVWSIDMRDSMQTATSGSSASPTAVAGPHQQQQQQQGRRIYLRPCCVTREMPNSSFVKRCHGCQGRGKLKCNLCHGVGYEVCLSCSGKGTNRSYSGAARSSASSAGHAFRGRSQSAGYGGGGDIGGADEPTGPYGGATANSRDTRGDSSSSSAAAAAAGFGGASLGGLFGGDSCGNCHGAGQKRCWVCAGKSYLLCSGCAGLGSLRCFLALTVSWLSHTDHVIVNDPDQIIPQDRLRVATGLLLVDRIEDRLRPLAVKANLQDPNQNRTQEPGLANSKSGLCSMGELEQLSVASGRLLERHKQTCRGEKLLKQRLKVTLVRCQLVRYEWKKRRGQFVIYGEDRKVYIGKYPFKGLCNII